MFVDAVIPARSGATEASERIREFAAQLADADGILPRWSEWWEPGTMAALVPDDAVRAAIEGEQVRLAADFYDEPVPVPDGWEPGTVTYVQISPAYDAEAADAADRGWQVRTLPGQHLDIAARPDEVADTILAAGGVSVKTADGAGS